MSKPEFGNLDDIGLVKSKKRGKKKKIVFDLVSTIVEALENDEETLEQLEYTLKNNPQLYEKIREKFYMYRSEF